MLDISQTIQLRADGAAAYRKGQGFADCPHPLFGPKGEQWRRGWLDAEAESATQRQGGFA